MARQQKQLVAEKADKEKPADKPDKGKAGAARPDKAKAGEKSSKGKGKPAGEPAKGKKPEK